MKLVPRSACVLGFASAACLLIVSGCESPPHKPTASLEVVWEGYSSSGSIRDPRHLEVYEYSPAVGDTFGPEVCWEPQRRLPFILVAAPDTGRAIINYPSCLTMMNGWWLYHYSGATPYATVRPRPPRAGDTLTVTTRWSHMTTGGIDGGCYVSIRLRRGPSAR